MPIDQALFRRAAGSFATGVTIVTTGRDGVYHGMTASSFASLSLKPTLVLICVDREAHTYPLMLETGAFNVNVLAAGQEDLSRIFASKDAPERHSFEGIDYSIGEDGVPLIRGAIAYFECRIVQQYDGGDHVIFIGEVEAAGASEEGEPLLYYRGRYRQVDSD